MTNLKTQACPWIGTEDEHLFHYSFNSESFYQRFSSRLITRCPLCLLILVGTKIQSTLIFGTLIPIKLWTSPFLTLFTASSTPGIFPMCPLRLNHQHNCLLWTFPSLLALKPDQPCSPHICLSSSPNSTTTRPQMEKMTFSLHFAPSKPSYSLLHKHAHLYFMTSNYRITPFFPAAVPKGSPGQSPYHCTPIPQIF